MRAALAVLLLAACATEPVEERPNLTGTFSCYSMKVGTTDGGHDVIAMHCMPFQHP